MDALNTILNSSVLANLLWVAVIIVVSLVFKKELIGLLSRLKEAEWGRGKATFGEPKIEPSQEPQEVSRDGSFFNLGLHLTWTAHVIRVGRENEDILRAFENSASSAEACGLDKHAEAFRKLRQNLQTQPQALSEKDRKALFQNLVSLRKEISQQLAVK